MADPVKTKPMASETRTDRPPEELDAIRAAMMEELGNARKDTLPLEDNKAERGQVNLQAPNQSKKANKKKSPEFQLAQSNAVAHKAWNSLQLEADPADEGLDDMDSGQSHRLGMRARLEATVSPSRGRGNNTHAHRGDISGRGGHLAARGGNSYNTGRMAGAKLAPARIRSASANHEVRGQSTPRGKIPNSKSGPTRGGPQASPRKIGVVSAPRTAVSLNDRQSAKALPIDRDITGADIPGPNMEGQGTSKAHPPVKPAASFKLATPEQFLERIWLKPSSTSASTENTTEINRGVAALQLVEETTKMQSVGRPREKTFLERLWPDRPSSAPIIIDTPTGMSRIATALQPPDKNTETQPRLGLRDEPFVDATGFANKGPQVQPAGRTSLGFQSGVPSDPILSVGARARISYGLRTSDIGPGEMLIVLNRSDNKDTYMLQFKANGKLHLKLPLVESFSYTIKDSILLFNSTHNERPCKWMVETHLPWMLKSLDRSINYHKGLPNLPYESTPIIETGLSYTENAENLETLISFSEDDVAHPVVSSWAQDLLCLMDGNASEEAVRLFSSQVSQPPSDDHFGLIDASKGSEGFASVAMEDTETEISRLTFKGLAPSRYASLEMADKYLDENPPQLGNPEADRLFGNEFKRRVAASTICSSNSENLNLVDRLADTGMEDIIQKQEPQDQSHTPDQPLIQMETFAQQPPNPKNSPRLQYTVEEMKTFRANARVLTKPLMDQWIKQPQRGRHNPAETVATSEVASAKLKNLGTVEVAARNIVNTTLQRALIVAGTERPNILKGLASSTYATSKTSNTGHPRFPSSSSQSVSEKTSEQSNNDTQLNMKNSMEHKVLRSVELSTSSSTLQSAISGICPADGPKPLAATGDIPFTKMPSRVAQNVGQHGDLKVEAQPEQGHYPAVDHLENLRKRESYTSLASKDSDLTVTPSKTVSDYKDLPQSYVTTSQRHTSHSSIDSNTSSASFATASEGKVARENEPVRQNSIKQLQVNLNQSMDAEKVLEPSVEFPSEHVVESGKAGSTLPMKTPSSDDMLTSNKISTAFTDKQDSSSQMISRSSQAFRRPTPSKDMSLLKAKGGLASSVFARTESTLPPALDIIDNRSRTRTLNPDFPVMDQTAFGSYGSYAHNAPANGFGQPLNHGSFPLPPMAISARMNPVVATVVIGDPSIPGGLLEVTGQLKIGDSGASPLVAHLPVIAGQFPVYTGRVNENNGPGYAPSVPFSPPTTMAVLARTSLSPRTPKLGKRTDNTADVQQEVQLRLQRSLASPRSSVSPP